MRKFISLFLCLAVLLLFGCSNGEKPGPEDEGNNSNNGIDLTKGESILTDKNFVNGFNIRGLGNPIYPEKGDEEKNGSDSVLGRVGEFKYGLTNTVVPDWTIAQWSTRYSFNNSEHTQFNKKRDGVYEYANTSKRLMVDTNSGGFDMELKASECYVYGDRVFGQEWPHLLIERDIALTDNNLTKISDKEQVVATVTSKLNSYVDNMDGKGNPGLHAAQMMLYVYVANLDPEYKVFNDMLWLGIMIFDNRTEFIAQADFVDEGTKGSATEKYIYNLPSDAFLSKDNNFWKDGKIVSGEDSAWVTATVDILPYIELALQRAKLNGCMKKAKYENLHINGMYLGYELPGNYDIDMSFKNLDIRVY